jgi:Uncharacterized conserved protein (DUF2285)
MGRYAPLPFMPPPIADRITEYDQQSVKLYLMIFDRDQAGAGWRENAFDLFGIDPNREPELAQQLHRTHLDRAKWMVKGGWRHLLKMSNPHT